MNLKIFVMLILINLFIAQSAVAEDSGTTSMATPSSQLEIIPQIGYTSFDLTGLSKNGNIPAENTSAKGGSSAAVLVGYKLGFLNSTLEAGLGYLETGSEVELNYGILTLATVETTLQYVTLPVFWRVPVGEWLDVKWHAKAGGMAAFLVGADIKGTGIFETDELDIDKSVNDFDFLAQAGIGGSYHLMDNLTFHGDLAYLRGLYEVDKKGGGYNQGISFTLGLAISI